MPEANVVSIDFDCEDLNPAVKSVARYRVHPLCGTKKIHRWITHAWIMGYVWQPAVETRVGSADSPWRLRDAKTMHLYPPGLECWENFGTARKQFAGMWFIIKGAQVAGLDKLIAPGQHYAKFLDPEGIVGAIFVELSKELARFGQDAQASSQAALWSICNLMQKARHIENEDYLIRDTHFAYEESFSAQVENYLKNHYSEKITLEKLAEFFDTSTATLTRRFRAERQASPMARLNEIRIDIVKTLLLHGSKLCEIATSTGFSDEFHLSKTFKKITGQSPREFLKSLE